MKWSLFLVATAAISTLLFTTDAATASRKQCNIDINKDLHDNQPIILKKSYNTIVPVFPRPTKDTGILTLKSGEQYLLACPGSRITFTKTQEALVTCIQDLIFSVNKTTVNFNELGCSRTASSTVRRTNSTCFGGYTWAEIGFEVNNTWLPQIGVCHDEFASNTLYSKHVLYGSAIGGSERESKRPKFQEGGFYPSINANRAYTMKGQFATVEKLLGSEEQAKKLLNQKKNLFFSRGHLAPDGDFIFGAWQFASYYYINVAPQWQVFNGGNWLYAENAVRDYARDNNLELEIYTGTHGITSLLDVNNNPVDIYLVPGATVSRIPAPRYYWKVIYHRSTNRGVALIGLNDPYEKDPQPDLCDDICDRLSWVDWSIDNVSRGYMYCCEIDDLKQKIPYVPLLQVGKPIAVKLNDLYESLCS